MYGLIILIIDASHGSVMQSNLLKEAQTLDENDKLSHLRSDFFVPENKTYLCGNSLGLLPKQTQILINQELQVWASAGVEGHFDHTFDRPWVSTDTDNISLPMSKIVGNSFKSAVD